LSTFQRIYWPLGWVPPIHLSFICPFSFYLFLTSIWILAMCRVDGWTPFEMLHATGKKNLAVVQHNLQLHSSYSEIQVHFFLTVFTHLVTQVHSWSNFFIHYFFLVYPGSYDLLSAYLVFGMFNTRLVSTLLCLKNFSFLTLNSEVCK
jgi:hypothetical protein